MEKDKNNHYEALAEMAETEGWLVIEEMLNYDVKFGTKLCTLPSPPKKIGVDATGNIIMSEPKYLVDPHELGRGRAMIAVAKKYLDKVRMAREKINKS